MSWEEPVGDKWRARRSRRDLSDEVGPVLPTRGMAERWAIQNGWKLGFSHKLLDIVAEWRRVRSADDEAVDPRFLLATEARLGSVFEKLGWLDVRDISISEFDRWRTHPEIGFRRNATYLLSILRWGRRHLKITVDPDILDWQFPRQRRQIPVRKKLTTEQVLDALETAMGWGVHAHGLLHYLSTYGPRPSSAARMLIKQIDFTNETLDISAKTSGEWRHKLQGKTLEIFAQLAHRRDRNERLFLRPFIGRGNTITRVTREPWSLRSSANDSQQLRDWYQTKIAGEGVLDFPPDLVQIYHLKRYAITTALRRGLTAKEVSLFTGHLSIEQVMTYAETDEHESGEVVDRLGPHAVEQPATAWKQVPAVERLGAGATVTYASMTTAQIPTQIHTVRPR